MSINIPYLKSFDFNTLKNRMRRGQTHKHTDIATTSPNRPVGRFGENYSKLNSYIYCLLFLTTTEENQPRQLKSLFLPLLVFCVVRKFFPLPI